MVKGRSETYDVQIGITGADSNNYCAAVKIRVKNYECLSTSGFFLSLFTCGEARRSMDHNSSPSHFIWLLEAFRSRRDTGTYIFEAREFDSEAICILRGRPEAVDKAVASYCAIGGCENR